MFHYIIKSRSVGTKYNDMYGEDLNIYEYDKYVLLDDLIIRVSKLVNDCKNNSYYSETTPTDFVELFEKELKELEQKRIL